MRKKYDLSIIGAGASGIIAAIIAARKGKKVVLIEKNKQIGKKILVTGNGRCNISNINVKKDYKSPIHYYGENPKFVISIFNQFGLDDTKLFFNNLGIEFIEKNSSDLGKGRLFPASNQAQAVLDVLKYELDRLNIKIIKNAKINDINLINKDQPLFEICLKDNRKFISSNVLISTGGRAYPQMGSSGDGWEWAKKFNHKIIKPFPAFVGLNVKSLICHFLQGVKLNVNIKAYYFNDKDKTSYEFVENNGTLMFTHYGLSAPVVLKISRDISYHINVLKNQVFLKINFLPAILEQDIDRFLVNRFLKMPHRNLSSSFIGILPKKVFPLLLKTENMQDFKDIKCSQVNKNLRKKLIKLLTKFELQIDSTRDFSEAHFTAGGVDTKEINPKTLESKNQKGLYFSGEILDIDGDCGGYNLQWAWSTGAIVGDSV